MSREPVCRQTITVNSENGLHLIPGSRIAELAMRYDCELKIRKGDRIADAKSVLDIMSLEAEYGAQLDLEATGEKAAEALGALVRLFESDFQCDDASAS
jgi:phosphotransferase system HPr (HPr) family protein